MRAFEWVTDELADLHCDGLLRTRPGAAPTSGPRIHVGRRDLVNFASNDYLNLAGDTRLARAAARAARRHGCGAGASPLVSGWHPALRRLERNLARFEREESALVFTSGYAANLGTIAALVGPEDAIFSDRLNHASIIDGCRLSGAAVHIYEHADAGHLESILRTKEVKAGRRLIVTDSIFGMDGDLAPLADLSELAERHEAMLLVDEAHASGVLGPTGRGVTETLARRPALIKLGTLSKAVGAQGGFVCGPRVLCDWLINKARPYVFSTAPAPPTCAAARRALRIIDEEPQRRSHVLRLAEILREALREQGFDVGRSACHIVPVIVGEPAEALLLSARLRERGFFVPAIRPPSVPPGTSRLRMGVTAGHTEEDIEGLVRALAAERTGCHADRR